MMLLQCYVTSVGTEEIADKSVNGILNFVKSTGRFVYNALHRLRSTSHGSFFPHGYHNGVCGEDEGVYLRSSRNPQT